MAANLRKFALLMMGKPVVYDAYLMREYSHHEGSRAIQKWVSCPTEERHGWVVGMRWLQTGYNNSRTAYGYGWGDDGEPSPFVETEPRQVCYLVTPWPSMNSVRVPPENVRLVDLADFSPSSWSEEMKRLTRKAAKHWARDKKGRWVKEG